jgi:hypothetical protein
MVLGSGDTPRYDVALKNKNRRKIISVLAQLGGEASFAQIEHASNIQGNTLVHNLAVLQRYNIINKPVKGKYSLRYKTPICYMFGPPNTYHVVYLGLLGRKEGRDIPETEVALKLLEKEGIMPKLVYVATTPQALQEWSELKPPYRWVTLYEDEIFDINSVKNRVRPQLENLIKDYVVILDCTSATKPATIALYELANQYLIPLIYVYEPIQRLTWLISKDELIQRIEIRISNTV